MDFFLLINFYYEIPIEFEHLNLDNDFPIFKNFAISQQLSSPCELQTALVNDTTCVVFFLLL